MQYDSKLNQCWKRLSIFSDRALLCILNKLCPGPHHRQCREIDDEHTQLQCALCRAHSMHHPPVLHLQPSCQCGQQFCTYLHSLGRCSYCSGCAVDATAAPQCMLSCRFPSLLSLAIILQKKEILRRREMGETAVQK